MALTRARIVCGDEDLKQQAEAVIAEILATPRDRAKVAADVAEMRGLIDKEKPPRDIWDFKLIPGGLIDIEFIAQYLALTGDRMAGRGASTAEALKSLGEGRLGPEEMETCLGALTLYGELSQIIRLCIDGPFEPKDAPAGLVDLICTAVDVPTLKMLEADLSRMSKAVRRIFQATVK